MPNAVIAHEPSGKFDLDTLKQEAREWPGLVGMDLVPMVTSGQRFPGTRRRGSGARATAGSTSRKFHVVAIDYGIKRNILRPVGERRLQGDRGAGQDQRRGHLPRSIPTAFSCPTARRSGGDRAICGAGDQEADRFRHAHVREFASATRCSASRSAAVR
jgi:hypothetical protein